MYIYIYIYVYRFIICEEEQTIGKLWLNNPSIGSKELLKWQS